MRTFKPHAAISLGIAFTILLSLPDSVSAQRKKRQSRRPSISLAKVYKDIVGKVVERVPPAETGSALANWTFAENEPREIEVLERKFAEDTASVTIKMYTQEASPNSNGLWTSLRGNLRLYYERIAGDWLLTEVENLTFKYTVHDSTGKTINRSEAITPDHSTNPLVNGAFAVGAGQHRYYRFEVSNRADVSGRFRAQGGGNDIEVFILDEDGYENFKNGHNTPTYYNSGRVTVGTVRANLGAGVYYLVFNNGYSIITNKAVEAFVEVRYE